MLRVSHNDSMACLQILFRKDFLKCVLWRTQHCSSPTNSFFISYSTLHPLPFLPHTTRSLQFSECVYTPTSFCIHQVQAKCTAFGQIWKEKKKLQQSLKWEYHSRAKSEVILKLENNVCCIWTCNELTDQILHVSLEGVATEIRQVKDVKKIFFKCIISLWF